MAVLPGESRRVVLAARPVGWPRPEDFRPERVALPEPGPGQLLVRSVYLALDRGRNLGKALVRLGPDPIRPRGGPAA